MRGDAEVGPVDSRLKFLGRAGYHHLGLSTCVAAFPIRTITVVSLLPDTMSVKARGALLLLTSGAILRCIRQTWAAAQGRG